MDTVYSVNCRTSAMIPMKMEVMNRLASKSSLTMSHFSDECIASIWPSKVDTVRNILSHWLQGNIMGGLGLWERLSETICLLLGETLQGGAPVISEDPVEEFLASVGPG